MPSSWTSFIRRSVVGSLLLGGALIAWTTIPESGSTDEPSSDDRTETITLVYSTDDPDTTSRYRNRAEAWASFWDDDDDDVRVRADTQWVRDSEGPGRTVIAGTPSSSLVSDLLAERGVTVQEEGAFVLSGHTYDDPDDVLVLDPAARAASREERALHLSVGQTDAAVLDYAYASPFLFSGLRTDYKLLRDGRLLAYGTRSDTTTRSAGTCTISPPPARHVDLRPAATPVVETDHFRFFGHGTLDRSAVQQFADRRTSVSQSLWNANSSPPSEKIDYHLFRTHADVRYFGASVAPVGTNREEWLRSLWRRDRSAPAMNVRLDSTSGALAAVVPDKSDPVPPTEARRWVSASTESSSSGSLRPLLDVGRVALAQRTWYGRPVEAWTARLHAADAVPSLRALAMDTTLVHESPYAQGPVAATLVHFLRETGSIELNSGGLPPVAPEHLEPAWQRHLDSLTAEHVPTTDSISALPPALYGANVAFATGPAWASFGYASRAGEASLTALKEMGATAASIVPYTSMPRPDAPADLLRRRHHGSSQSDATIVHALRTAHDLGLDVMLKPQISGAVEWPGAVEMDTAEDWDRFFTAYTDWMLHYALMAELHDVEVLAVGTELVAATRHHEAEWRRLIERVRAVYDGAVVYAANWGDEVERLAFADALDAVGVDSYYPLSDDSAATDAELRAGAEKVARRLQDVAERTGRPVLLTEMGFPNTRAAWIRPHRKREDEPERPAHQARATRALATALSDVPIRGAFWWRWPPICRFDYGRFPPQAPTREVLREWFEGITGSDSPS